MIEVGLLRLEGCQFGVRGPQGVGSGECQEVLADALGFLFRPLSADAGHDHLRRVVDGKLFDLRRRQHAVVDAEIVDRPAERPVARLGGRA